MNGMGQELKEAQSEIQKLKIDLSLALSQRANLVSDLTVLKDRVNGLTARKAEIDEPLNLLLKDPEVEAVLLRKVKELLREGKLTT